ncbi:hypothetical protein INT43_004979 [Umbelopsis isabellina]|uniref:2,5-diamino-6-ribosylamino-4(3H)-pyrimidinone 5'-phosphate reductase n=1 Tax=Mortierella isabellina TaxID=91625 RepID=A0A8H7PEF8_MORIS|nr:hypothetical protein INT43_004979 [Umbelopsis isabellina]
MTDTAWSFLQPLYANLPNDRVHVTLTYAQSLDGRIAGPQGKQIRLSSKESMTMTHTLRLHMDCILIGIDTLMNDGPRLTGEDNAREEYVGRDNLVKYTQPYPIILDTNLRCTVDVSLIRHAATKATVLPIIFTTVDRNDEEHNGRWCELENAGAKIYSVNRDANGHVSLSAVLDKLKDLKMRHIMIEGGAKIIQSCLKLHDLLDVVIVTIAPTYIGNGISILPENSVEAIAPLDNIRYQQFGRDMVMAATI